MSKVDRSKDRKKRSRLFPRKSFELGYYYIVTDTKETEKNYFEGLKNSLPKSIKDRITIKVEKEKTDKLVDKVLSTSRENYSNNWIVFDRDRVKDFDRIIEKAYSKDINVGWSNPCFEVWLHAYFGSMPTNTESKKCWEDFAKEYKRRTGLEYDKADKNIYKHIKSKDNELKAIDIAEKRLRQHKNEGKIKPSMMCPSTTVHTLVKEIIEKK